MYGFTCTLKSQVEVLQLWLDEEDSDMAHSGENIKMKLKNVEEEVSYFSALFLSSYLLIHMYTFESRHPTFNFQI